MIIIFITMTVEMILILFKAQNYCIEPSTSADIITNLLNLVKGSGYWLLSKPCS